MTEENHLPLASELEYFLIRICTERDSKHGEEKLCGTLSGDLGHWDTEALNLLTIFLFLCGIKEVSS